MQSGELFYDIAFPFETGTEGFIEMLEFPCFGVLCLLCLALLVLPRLPSTRHRAGDRTNAGTGTGISGYGPYCRAANCPPRRPFDALTATNCRTGWGRWCTGDGSGVNTCLLFCPGVTLPLILALLRWGLTLGRERNNPKRR